MTALEFEQKRQNSVQIECASFVVERFDYEDVQNKFKRLVQTNSSQDHLL